MQTKSFSECESSLHPAQRENPSNTKSISAPTVLTSAIYVCHKLHQRRFYATSDGFAVTSRTRRPITVFIIVEATSMKFVEIRQLAFACQFQLFPNVNKQNGAFRTCKPLRWFSYFLYSLILHNSVNYFTLDSHIHLQIEMNFLYILYANMYTYVFTYYSQFQLCLRIPTNISL